MTAWILRGKYFHIHQQENKGTVPSEEESWWPPTASLAMKDQKFQNSPYISEFHVNICDISVRGEGERPTLIIREDPKTKELGVL